VPWRAIADATLKIKRGSRLVTGDDNMMDIIAELCNLHGKSCKKNEKYHRQKVVFFKKIVDDTISFIPLGEENLRNKKESRIKNTTDNP
jgi:hypothetical protein